MAYILTRKNPIVTETKTGSILTFNSALPVVADDVSSLISGYQEGSGTPAPDNVRNLVSFDECMISRYGKNLFDGKYPNIDITAIRYRQIKVANGTYTFSTTCPRTTVGAANLFAFAGYVISGASTFNNGIWRDKPKTVTTTDGYITIAYRNSGEGANPVDFDTQIEIGSTPTTYENYTGNNYTFTFGQSIYEGTIDFTTGVLTANRILVTLTGDSSESYALSASNRRINYSISGILLNSGVDDTVDGYLCNRFEQITPNQSYSTNMGFAVNTTNSVIFFNDGSGEMTVEGWRTWLASNNIQLVVMLATPLEIQLTPTEISLLQGTNNLWSSTGNLTVQFKNVK